MNDQWFYGENGQQRGPISLAALRDRVSAGLTRTDDLVWREGMSAWTAAASVPELADLASAAPAAGVIPAQQATHGYAGAGPVNYYNQMDGLSNYTFVGFWWRVLSYIIDSILLQVIAVPLAVIINIIATEGSTEHTLLSLAASLINIAASWLYFALMESSSKQATLGKMAIGVRVVDAYGQRLTFGRATGRFFSKILSGLILGVGFLMVAFTQYKQGLHDMIASTFVVRPRQQGYPMQ